MLETRVKLLNLNEIIHCRPHCSISLCSAFRLSLRRNFFPFSFACPFCTFIPIILFHTFVAFSSSISSYPILSLAESRCTHSVDECVRVYAFSLVVREKYTRFLVDSNQPFCLFVSIALFSTFISSFFPFCFAFFGY